ncbi:PREDICTED: medium-wave-sensitive opsin 1-like [Amphimedon queenslandica]|uniref:G-protein coupled receptors family 1 profile domain-containing protein n=1 Tax=Amphimedon queenslandica TaxID=400682 RepID=A0A1X7UKL6_AMPQE|nr:PREDICTED: medium-wave-sensitive opsin 1-like [Amphimedon queenslandica]|eukprot:XP_011404796.1 PREDICTED: medium-wave-sensitive opsin 1-like [Amphimedon queenslandica]
MDIHGLNYTLGEDVNGPLLAAALAVEMIAALIVNTFVLVATFSQCKSLKLPSTILFTSLIMIHYVIALIYIPSWLISAAYGEWIFGSTIQVKEATCKFAGFILNYTLQVKSFTLAAISVDRWLFIVKPIFYKQYMKAKLAVVLAVIIWIGSCLSVATPFFGIGNYFFTEFGSCEPQFLGELGYSILMLIFVLTALCIIIVTSIWTCCFTRRFIREHAQLADESAYVSKNRRIIGIFGAMLVAYGVCYTPGIIVIIASLFCDVNAAAFAAVLVFFLTVIIINPIIQSVFRPDVKKVIVKLCAMCRKFHHSPEA